MSDEPRRQRAEQEPGQVARRVWQGSLLDRLRRAVAPRARAVLVMERDGRLVCNRVDEGVPPLGR
jgi:hypothetical protein